MRCPWSHLTDEGAGSERETHLAKATQPARDTLDHLFCDTDMTKSSYSESRACPECQALTPDHCLGQLRSKDKDTIVTCHLRRHHFFLKHLLTSDILHPTKEAKQLFITQMNASDRSFVQQLFIEHLLCVKPWDFSLQQYSMSPVLMKSRAAAISVLGCGQAEVGQGGGHPEPCLAPRGWESFLEESRSGAGDVGKDQSPQGCLCHSRVWTLPRNAREP